MCVCVLHKINPFVFIKKHNPTLEFISSTSITKLKEKHIIYNAKRNLKHEYVETSLSSYIRPTGTEPTSHPCPPPGSTGPWARF